MTVYSSSQVKKCVTKSSMHSISKETARVHWLASCWVQKCCVTVAGADSSQKLSSSCQRSLLKLPVHYKSCLLRTKDADQDRHSSLKSHSGSPVAKFIVPDWEYKVNSGIGLSYQPSGPPGDNYILQSGTKNLASVPPAATVLPAEETKHKRGSYENKTYIFYK